MCIILFAYKAHPRYNLILAANRDEYFARPTSRAAFWQDAPDILGGRDLERGGTWLGVTKEGKYAAVTNFRDPSLIKKDAPSRGSLVTDFLRSDQSPQVYLKRTALNSENHNGFNLIIGDWNGIYYYSNRDTRIRPLAPGVYGLSNQFLDTPWPKVANGKQALSEIIRQEREITPDLVFEILADRAQPDDVLLPNTGIGLEYERARSPIFITTPAYGTRSSTLVLIDMNGNATFTERTFEAGVRADDVTFRFQCRHRVV